MAKILRISFIVALAVVIFTEGVSAQKKHTEHQTIIPDQQISFIHIDLVDPWTIAPWSSNAILVEIYIELYQTNQVLNKYLLESDRYLVQTEIKSDTLKFIPVGMDRNNLKNQAGQTIREEVHYKFYMPAVFEQKEDGWLKKNEHP
jgi:hypothetical protein